MRRSSIQLLSAARKGDVDARREVGRRYLLGFDGFQRHVPTGIDYLTHPSIRHLDEAAVVIAESLSLRDLLHFGQEDVLRRAASAGSLLARVKLGACLCTRSGTLDAGIRWLQMAAEVGHGPARDAVKALAGPIDAHGLLAALQAASPASDGDAAQVALVAAREAHAAGEFNHLVRCLLAALALSASLSGELAEMVVAALQMAESQGLADIDIDVGHIQASLELRVGQGGWYAAYAQGRALCGIPCGALAPSRVVASANMRKGLASLLRAADAGCSDAWLCLYRISAAHETSVSNPHAARLYLEKAAQAGEPEAQRKLGALCMRTAASMEASEAAMGLLYQAARSGDAHARELLRSFVLPLQGRDEEARAVVAEVRRHDPCLAIRLDLSRSFGLTRLEALTVDPTEGIRPWGLAVGPNRYVAQARRGAARAVPALNDVAMEALRAAASFFGRGGHQHRAEGDLRQRSRRQRLHFRQHGVDPAMFFSPASTSTLESLRQGTKWAFRVRKDLRNALAD